MSIQVFAPLNIVTTATESETSNEENEDSTNVDVDGEISTGITTEET